MAQRRLFEEESDSSKLAVEMEMADRLRVPQDSRAPKSNEDEGMVESDSPNIGEEKDGDSTLVWESVARGAYSAEEAPARSEEESPALTRIKSETKVVSDIGNDIDPPLRLKKRSSESKKSEPDTTAPLETVVDYVASKATSLASSVAETFTGALSTPGGHAEQVQKKSAVKDELHVASPETSSWSAVSVASKIFEAATGEPKTPGHQAKADEKPSNTDAWHSVKTVASQIWDSVTADAHPESKNSEPGKAWVSPKPEVKHESGSQSDSNWNTASVAAKLWSGSDDNTHELSRDNKAQPNPHRNETESAPLSSTLQTAASIASKLWDGLTVESTSPKRTPESASDANHSKTEDSSTWHTVASVAGKLWDGLKTESPSNSESKDTPKAHESTTSLFDLRNLTPVGITTRVFETVLGSVSGDHSERRTQDDRHETKDKVDKNFLGIDLSTPSGHFSATAESSRRVDREEKAITDSPARKPAEARDTSEKQWPFGLDLATPASHYSAAGPEIYRREEKTPADSPARKQIEARETSERQWPLGLDFAAPAGHYSASGQENYRRLEREEKPISDSPARKPIEARETNERSLPFGFDFATPAGHYSAAGPDNYRHVEREDKPSTDPPARKPTEAARETSERQLPFGLDFATPAGHYSAAGPENYYRRDDRARNESSARDERATSKPSAEEAREIGWQTLNNAATSITNHVWDSLRSTLPAATPPERKERLTPAEETELKRTAQNVVDFATQTVAAPLASIFNLGKEHIERKEAPETIYVSPKPAPEAINQAPKPSDAQTKTSSWFNLDELRAQHADSSAAVAKLGTPPDQSIGKGPGGETATGVGKSSSGGDGGIARGGDYAAGDFRPGREEKPHAKEDRVQWSENSSKPAYEPTSTSKPSDRAGDAKPTDSAERNVSLSNLFQGASSNHDYRVPAPEQIGKPGPDLSKIADGNKLAGSENAKVINSDNSRVSGGDQSSSHSQPVVDSRTGPVHPASPATELRFPGVEAGRVEPAGRSASPIVPPANDSGIKYGDTHANPLPERASSGSQPSDSHKPMDLSGGKNNVSAAAEVSTQPSSKPIIDRVCADQPAAPHPQQFDSSSLSKARIEAVSAPVFPAVSQPVGLFFRTTADPESGKFGPIIAQTGGKFDFLTGRTGEPVLLPGTTRIADLGGAQRSDSLPAGRIDTGAIGLNGLRGESVPAPSSKLTPDGIRLTDAGFRDQSGLAPGVAIRSGDGTLIVKIGADGRPEASPGTKGSGAMEVGRNGEFISTRLAELGMRADGTLRVTEMGIRTNDPSTRVGESGTRFSEPGIRGTDASVRPGEPGIRPAESGGKGSELGVRNSDSAVKLGDPGRVGDLAGKVIADIGHRGDSAIRGSVDGGLRTDSTGRIVRTIDGAIAHGPDGVRTELSGRTLDGSSRIFDLSGRGVDVGYRPIRISGQVAGLDGRPLVPGIRQEYITTGGKRYLISEIGLAIVLAAGGIRRVLPSDRMPSSNGPKSGEGGRRPAQPLGSTDKKAVLAGDRSLKFLLPKDLAAQLATTRSAATKVTEKLQPTKIGKHQLLLDKGATEFFKALASETRSALNAVPPAQSRLALADGQGRLRQSLLGGFPGKTEVEELLNDQLPVDDGLNLEDPFLHTKLDTGLKREIGGNERLRPIFQDVDGDEEPQANQQVHRRPTCLIGQGDTLVAIAENLFSDPNIAWLIADLNVADTQEHWMDGKRIVEFNSRQQITLPVWQDIVDFYNAMPSNVDPDNLITIVRSTRLDRDVIDGALGKVMGTTLPGSSSVRTSGNRNTLASAEDFLLGAK